ncbi:MAG: hypothetical protein Q7S57_05940 [bacterium]|nr:hypothetical protein [bacterium]
MTKTTLNGFRKLANFQLSIFNFANNFQNWKFSKRNEVVVMFDNLRIDNSLKIGNWKLKILGVLNKGMSGRETFISGYSLI